MIYSDYPDFSHLAGTPHSWDLPALADCARRLSDIDYSCQSVEDLLGPGAFAALERDQLAPARRRVKVANADGRGDTGKLADTVALFMLGQTLSADRIDAALGAGASQLLKTLGLLESPAEPGYGKGGGTPVFRASVDLRPHRVSDTVEVWVASDPGAHQRPGPLRTDHVLGIGRASLSLARFTEREPVGRALDVGTGCGIQTFYLLTHARHVTATDVSLRALAFTRFNLLLNAGALGIDPENPEGRVSLRRGSLLEPVTGEKFDLVVSNPPFVISPRSSDETEQSRYTYRDGGLVGDTIVSTLVRQLPSVLVSRGRAQMLANWEIPSAPPGGQAGSDWSQRPRTWVGDESEAWFIQREVLSPEQYAETWLRDSSEHRNPELFEAAYTDYLRDFESRGVGSIGFGMVWLRRPADSIRPMLRRFEEITHPIQQPIAAFITEEVATHDTLSRITDGELEDSHLLVADDVTEERHSHPAAEHPGVIVLRRGVGLHRSLVETTATAGFVSACDGELTAGQIIGALEALLGWEAEEAEHQRRDLLGHIRLLIEQGFLCIVQEH